MFRKLKGISLSYKMSGIFILANLFIFVVDIALLFGINRMSVEMEMAYQNNRQLNALSIALDSLQDSTTEYLKAKSTDSLSDYYISEQNYANLVEELGTRVTDIPYTRMERNIRNMSYDYMDQVSQTIEAKRGRNVEKYRVLCYDYNCYIL